MTRPLSSGLALLVAGVLLANTLPAATTGATKAATVRYGEQATVLLFVSSMCPCTDAHRLTINSMMQEYADRGVTFYCIFSNRGERDDLIRNFYRGIGWTMPYVLDRSGELADLYGAKQTPTAILVGRLRQPLYRGPIDDANRNQGRVEHAYLRDALARLVAGEALTFSEVPPVGCWIVRETAALR